MFCSDLSARMSSRWAGERRSRDPYIPALVPGVLSQRSGDDGGGWSLTFLAKSLLFLAGALSLNEMLLGIAKL